MTQDSSDTQKIDEDAKVEGDGAADDAWADALAEQKQQTNEQQREDQEAGGFTSAEFQDLVDESSEKPLVENSNLEMILDIPVTISLEIGRTKISIRNLMQLNQGSVVELDRLAGESLDVLVNGMLIAHGEVVMVNEKYGIRLVDVISPTERLQNLK
ncbi:MAG: flagellar motor switch protein FliN [Gammaproteobacteria bacterium]|nr:flagellar motor switch protein FliN [Gammaproteobacteria bacterium]